MCFYLFGSCLSFFFFFFFNDTSTTEIYTLSLHDALPIGPAGLPRRPGSPRALGLCGHLLRLGADPPATRRSVLAGTSPRPRPRWHARRKGPGRDASRSLVGPDRRRRRA